MVAPYEAKPWDLSHVLDLANSLSLGDPRSQNRGHAEAGQDRNLGGEELKHESNGVEEKDFAAQPQVLGDSQALGDFNRIFQFLGTPTTSSAPAPPVQTPESEGTEDSIFKTKQDYASDGATYSKTTPHAAFKGSGDTTEDPASDSSLVPDTPTLTKSQRKKRNRKVKKEQERAREAEEEAKQATVSESEADILSRKAPATTASTHKLAKQRNHLTFIEQKASRKANLSNDPDPLLEAANVARQSLAAAKQADLEASLTKTKDTPKNTDLKVQNRVPNGHSQTAPPKQYANGGGAHASRYEVSLRQDPQATHLQGGVTQFVPATVRPMQTPPKSYPKPQPLVQSHSTVPQKSSGIQPMVVRSGEARNLALLMKLIQNFFEDGSENGKYLVAPMNLTTHNNDPKGIHVFVDASNIFIGFNDQLKYSRGIPYHVKVDPVNLSFDALALLLERRRPVAKRVLAGSTPRVPAYDKADEVGYQTSILDKVWKARKLTERQIYFKAIDDANRARRRAKAPPANNVATVNGGGSGSGSETNTPQYAKPAMVEQGVDEVLHLKILESIVDTDEPSTIVLATGDAAQAEYSEGFMAQLERALKKGWAVELVSWSKNISAMYTRREWTEAWGDRFKIITLDDYAEELLDM